MSEQPNALRLADLLRDESGVDGYVHDEAATELVRLHEAREQDRRAMREALEALEKSTVTGHYECRCEGRDHWPHCYWKKHQNALAHLRQRLEQP